ncbi:hypothetical protein E2C01_047912 [Portunus trituberculatus]|uniref:Uncharacterized protein n=1 Tax=Portunus trituberculatus TaxID=210409 RepID=A0A5B7G907_PORTR|nr:hypothetical protein [Portunus trituberculatus]
MPLTPTLTSPTCSLTTSSVMLLDAARTAGGRWWLRVLSLAFRPRHSTRHWLSMMATALLCCLLT